jgi:hypothetical protein
MLNKSIAKHFLQRARMEQMFNSLVRIRKATLLTTIPKKKIAKLFLVKNTLL